MRPFITLSLHYLCKMVVEFTSMVNMSRRSHNCAVRRRALSVSHLFFANDSLLFCRVTREECLTLKNSLELYERASGQAVNFLKSGIFFSTNVSFEDREVMKEIIGV